MAPEQHLQKNMATIGGCFSGLNSDDLKMSDYLDATTASTAKGNLEYITAIKKRFGTTALRFWPSNRWGLIAYRLKMSALRAIIGGKCTRLRRKSSSTWSPQPPRQACQFPATAHSKSLAQEPHIPSMRLPTSQADAVPLQQRSVRYRRVPNGLLHDLRLCQDTQQALPGKTDPRVLIGTASHTTSRLRFTVDWAVGLSLIDSAY